jgi:hypothetical protein
MLTRQSVAHSYGHCAGAVPPFHAVAPAHMEHLRGQVQRGGLRGGAVILNMPPGNVADTGYGYLGMDPSDPASWPRPFAPQPGMISRPITRIEYGRAGLR